MRGERSLRRRYTLGMYIGTTVSCQQCGATHTLVWRAQAGVDLAARGKTVEFSCPKTGENVRFVLPQRAILFPEPPPKGVEARIVG